jgi:hypothetical protein
MTMPESIQALMRGDVHVAGRRQLSFARLDDVMPELDRLLAGHATVGNWTLGQICSHLASTLRVAADPPRPMPWIVRRTAGPLLMRYILRRGSMPAGVKAPADLVPKPGLDARAEAEALRATIRLYHERVPERFEHPFFGRVAKADLTRLQCIHCAHHLSFVLPQEDRPA